MRDEKGMGCKTPAVPATVIFVAFTNNHCLTTGRCEQEESQETCQMRNKLSFREKERVKQVFFPGLFIELKVKKCARCHMEVKCLRDKIQDCDCSKILISNYEQNYIASQYKGCLCNDCLKYLKKEFLNRN